MRSARRRRPASGSRRPARAPRRSSRWSLQRAGVLERGDRAVLGERPRVAAGELAGVQRDREDLALADARPRRGGRPAAGPASSRRCRSAGRDPAGRAAPSAGRCPAPSRAAAPSPRAPRSAGRSAGSAASCASAGSPARRTRRRAAAGSRARWRTRRPGSKLRLDEVLQALDDALGLRIARLAEVPADPQLRRRTRRTPRSGGRRRRAARPGGPRPASRGSAPSDHKQRRIPNSRSGGLLGEDQRAGARARVAQARDHDPAAARLAVADRDLARRLPQIELADLARPIDRALKRPRRVTNSGRTSRR